MSSLNMITPKNVENLRLIGVIGRGAVNGPASWSPDGRYIAVGSDSGAWVYDTKLPDQRPRHYGQVVPVSCVVFSPDGRTLAAAVTKFNVVAWDVVTGEERFNKIGQIGPEMLGMTFVRYSTDGTVLMAGDSLLKLYLWDARNGTLLDEQNLNNYDTDLSGEFTPDALYRVANGAVTVTGTHKTLSIDMPTSTPTRTIFSPDGKTLVVGDQFGKLYFIEFRSGKLTNTLAGNRGPVEQIVFSPDGTLLITSSSRGILQTWNTRSGQRLRTFTVPGYTGGQAPVVSPQDDLFAIQTGDGTELREIQTGQLRTRLPQVQHPVFRPNGLAVAGEYKRSVGWWNVQTGEPQGILPGHEAIGSNIAFSRDSQRIAFGDYSGQVSVSSVPSGNPLTVLGGHRGTVTSVVFGSNSNILASGSADGTIRIWDLESGKAVHILDDGGPVESIALCGSDNTLVSAGEQGLTMWDAATTRSDRLAGGIFRHVIFSPDCKMLAAWRGDGQIQLWDAFTRKLLQVRQTPGTGDDPGSQYAPVMAFNPSGSLLIYMVSEAQSRSIRTSDGVDGPTFDWVQGPTVALAFNPEGTLLIRAYENPSYEGIADFHTVTPDGPMALDMNGKLFIFWSGIGDSVFSPDGKLLAINEGQGAVLLWGVANS